MRDHTVHSLIMAGLVLLFVCLSAVTGADAAAPSRPVFAKDYHATFTRDVLFFEDGSKMTTTDGTIVQSAVLEARKKSGIFEYVDFTDLELFRQNVSYGWFTWWGLCSKNNISRDLHYFDRLSGIENTEYAGLVAYNGRLVQLWSISVPNITWDFYVSNDEHQIPLRVFLNTTMSGSDLELSSFKAGTSPDDFKPAFSCSILTRDQLLAEQKMMMEDKRSAHISGNVAAAWRTKQAAAAKLERVMQDVKRQYLSAKPQQ